MIVGVGALLFASGSTFAASAGRVLQGAGGAFALIGAAYIVTTSFPASRAATLIGATQMFGMAGGAVSGSRSACSWCSPPAANADGSP